MNTEKLLKVLFGNNYWAPRNYWAHSCDPPDFVRKVTLYVPAFSRVAWLDNVEQMYFSVFRGDDELLLADQKTLDEYREKKASSKLLKDEARLKESRKRLQGLLNDYRRSSHSADGRETGSQKHHT